MAAMEPVVACDALVGEDVLSPGGERLGTIEQIVIDISQGRIAYAVLAHGGVFGIGEKLFAIPWSAFTHDGEGGGLVLDVARERLENARGPDPICQLLRS
jgi:sporulation protein YlmC with PRC-barrel domain